ncbi:MAG: symporter small accessory protein [Desulfovibrionaceae bacterium]
MLGLGSTEIAIAFWLVIICSAVCVGYGALNWNRGGEEDVVDPEREEASAHLLADAREEAAQ